MKLNKNLKIILATTVIATAITVPNISKAETVFDGPYLGLQLGVGKTTSDYNYTLTSETGKLKDTSMNIGVMAGYGKVFSDKIYIGGEIAYTRGNISDNFSIAGVNFKIEQNETLELTPKIGYLVQDDFMLYGRVGWVRTNFETSAGNSSDDDNLNGIRFGLGAEKMLNSSISGRFDFTFTNYEDVSYRDGTTAESLKIDTEEILGRIGISYRF